MPKSNNYLTALVIYAVAALILGYFLRSFYLNEQLYEIFNNLGLWAPVIYILVYVVVTLTLLPSSIFNVLSGALFGAFYGTIWTCLGAICAAVISFFIARVLGYEYVNTKLEKKSLLLEEELKRGGIMYFFAVRLIPIFPYGFINYIAGVLPIDSKKYLLGTIPGIFCGILPFVFLGSSGANALTTKDYLPLLLSSLAIGLLILFGTWYQNQRVKSLKDESI